MIGSITLRLGAETTLGSKQTAADMKDNFDHIQIPRNKHFICRNPVREAANWQQCVRLQCPTMTVHLALMMHAVIYVCVCVCAYKEQAEHRKRDVTAYVKIT